jgi:2-polyprenyl-3-methyl-5-hydroxy-6-metoxy-1,4-benzoquinol methylase
MNVERGQPGTPEWAELAAPHLARYLFAAGFANGRRVLDVGSGAGYGAAVLRAADAAGVHGVDIDSEAVAQARARHGGPDVTFAVDDCQQLASSNGEWDIICCFETIEHVSRPEAMLMATSRHLAPGGVLLVSTPDRASTAPFVDGRPRNRFHAHEWYRDEFLTLVRRYFHDVELHVQVETAAAQARREAVAALRQGLMASNPLFVLAWRKWPRRRRDERPWARLADLAAPGIADFPVVPAALADVYGAPRFHVAVCRRPIAGEVA